MHRLEFSPYITLRAIATYILLWIPALLIALLITVGSVPVFVRVPIRGAISFLLALPAVLIGIKSFRISAITMTIAFLWDLVRVTWPHITLSGIFDSVTDGLLLVCAVLTILVAAASPFDSIIAFTRHLLNR
jgi:hypothetical protein